MKRILAILAITFAVHAAAATCLKTSVITIADPAPVADGRFGQVVASIGDVNGDGVADIAVGAPGSARVVIFSGATRSVIRTIPDPDGAAAKGTDFGFAVVAVGDVNGDGISDIAVGARGVDQFAPLPCPVDPCPPVPPEQGRAFLFSGANGALIRRLTPGGTEFLAFGFSLAALGDVNGDGVPDVAVGSPTRNNNSFGQVFAFSGANGALLWTAKEAKQALASFGHSLASIGDVNGDGRRDLVVGAIFHDIGGSNLVGRAYVLSGATGVQIRVHENPLGAAGKTFGAAVEDIGDQNADGVDDYAVSDIGVSAIYRFNGATGAAFATISSPDASTTDAFGLGLAATDDFSGDGRKDLWAGASKSGKAFLVNGGGASIVVVNDPTPAPQPAQFGFGWSVDDTPSLNGDATRDLLIGEPAANGGQGAAYVALLSRNKPPVANAGADQVAECAGSMTAVTLDGSASNDPDGDVLTYEWRNEANQIVGNTAKVNLQLPLGVHTFKLEVADACDSDTDEVSVTVEDTTPPSLSVSLSPASLWPPDHKLVEITATIATGDSCDAAPSVVLLSITSNEPENGQGDGNTTADIQGASFGTDDRKFFLRAERSGKGTGRVYTVTYRAADAAGNATVRTAEVRVAH